MSEDMVIYDDEETKPVRKRFTYVSEGDDEPELEEFPEFEVELGGQIYLSTCPNDYDFWEISRSLREMKAQGYRFNPRTLISGFFSPMDIDEIDARSRGGKHAQIRHEELMGALVWLVTEYEPYINDRFKASNRETRRAKKSPARQRGGRRA